MRVWAPTCPSSEPPRRQVCDLILHSIHSHALGTATLAGGRHPVLAGPVEISLLYAAAEYKGIASI